MKKYCETDLLQYQNITLIDLTNLWKKTHTSENSVALIMKSKKNASQAKLEKHFPIKNL